jgi:two-component system response regulator PilR (NtrC family)
VLLITAFATTDTAIAAMKRGAYDYLTKPFKVDEVTVVVERALEKVTLVRDNTALRGELQKGFRLDRLIGRSQSMRRLFDLVKKIAPTRSNVLVLGESGTGKELVAQAIHHLSPRGERPFVAVNCGAIPEALLESELFGHTRGAFTGAAQDRPGLFEAAQGGTLFLDEIGEISATLQVKLLRVLQERRLRPLGGTAEVELDVRVIAASNRDLEAEAARGTFRTDLYYRLNVIQVRVPPLRARPEDIPLLADHFARLFSAESGRPPISIDPAVLATLRDYDFPGNVRELENIVERAVALATDQRLTLDLLPELSRASRPPAAGAPMTIPDEGVDLDNVLGGIEREILRQALEKAGGVRKEAARLLGVTFRSLRYRLSKHGIEAGTGDDES